MTKVEIHVPFQTILFIFKESNITLQPLLITKCARLKEYSHFPKARRISTEIPPKSKSQ